VSEFVSDGGDGAVAREEDGFGREREYACTNRLKRRTIAGADTSDRTCKNHITDNGQRGIETLDFVNSSPNRMARNGVGGDTK
jgi:hypothetical protein